MEGDDAAADFWRHEGAWLDGMNQAGENLVPGVRALRFGELGPHTRLVHARREKLVMQ